MRSSNSAPRSRSAELWMDPEMWMMMSISFDDGDVLAQSFRSLLKVCYEYDLI